MTGSASYKLISSLGAFGHIAAEIFSFISEDGRIWSVLLLLLHWLEYIWLTSPILDVTMLFLLGGNIWKKRKEKVATVQTIENNYAFQSPAFWICKIGCRETFLFRLWNYKEIQLNLWMKLKNFPFSISIPGWNWKVRICFDEGSK